jgi:DNA-binding PadR family transcriptional regulator
VSIRQSLLAILDQGPCYGYQLRTEFNRRTGAAWPVNVGQIYNTLDRLERDGLVRKADTDKDGHVYYAITAAGSADVASWLHSPVVRAGAARDELAIKLAMALTLPGVDAANVFEVQRVASSHRLHELVVAKDSLGEAASTEALAATLIRDSMIFAAEAELRWLEHSAAQLAAASASGAHAPLQLNTDSPKRGRPAKAVDAATASLR